MTKRCTSGRTLAIGDIHGCDVALGVLLSKLALTADDTLVVLGDVVDRGDNSRRVVEQLLELRESCRLVFVMGNHEELMLDALQNGPKFGAWLRCGGEQTLESYGGRMERIPDEHRAFLAAAIPFWESDSEIFVHANLEPGVPLKDQTSDWLRWQRLTGLEFPHPSGKRVVCGHSGSRTGLPAILDGWVCVDTLAYRGLYLTCLDVATDELYQSRQSGELRYGVTLDELA